MKIDTTTLSPWAEIISLLGRMSSLTVTVGGVAHSGDAELTMDEASRAVTLAFPAPKVVPFKGKKAA